jgi:hypothetical protein
MLRRLSRVLLRRLDRVAAVVDGRQAARDRPERERQAREKFVGLLMGGLRDHGIDPATLPAMRRFDQPEPPPVAPPLRRRPPDARDRFFAKIARLKQRLRTRPPSLDTATPIELFAMYCFDETLVAPGQR